LNPVGFPAGSLWAVLVIKKSRLPELSWNAQNSRENLDTKPVKQERQLGQHPNDAQTRRSPQAAEWAKARTKEREQL